MVGSKAVKKGGLYEKILVGLFLGLLSVIFLSHNSYAETCGPIGDHWKRLPGRRHAHGAAADAASCYEYNGRDSGG